MQNHTELCEQNEYLDYIRQLCRQACRHCFCIMQSSLYSGHQQVTVNIKLASLQVRLR